MEDTGLICDKTSHQPIRLHADYGEGDEADYTLALFGYMDGVPALCAIPDEEDSPVEPISVNLSGYGFPSSDIVFWTNPDTPTLTATLLATGHAEKEDGLPTAHYGTGGRETSTAIRLIDAEILELGNPEDHAAGRFDPERYYRLTLPSILELPNLSK